MTDGWTGDALANCAAGAISVVGLTGGLRRVRPGAMVLVRGAYAVNAGRTVREFVPNAQVYGVVVNAFSVAANGVPELSAPRWGIVVAAMAIGAVIGVWLAGRTSERRARLVVLGPALVGGVTAAGKGLARGCECGGGGAPLTRLSTPWPRGSQTAHATGAGHRDAGAERTGVCAHGLQVVDLAVLNLRDPRREEVRGDGGLSPCQALFLADRPQPVPQGVRLRGGQRAPAQ
ncbi:hypothetical protein SAMN04487981_111207 [Streptomyces sp. cf386]|nr:hypothetical protein SAMN04487981_111207 [Streptomyces sp. cf386]